MAPPKTQDSVPLTSSKNWLNPATWVGSRVWSVMRVLFKTLKAAARRVVEGIGFQVTPNFGLNSFLSPTSGLSPLRKSALARE